MPFIEVSTAGANTNLLTNGDFEQSGGSIAGWSKTSAVLTIASDGVGVGYAAKVAYSGTAATYSLKSSPQPVTATQGTVYQADGMLRSDTPGKSVCLKIVESGTLSGNALLCTPSAATWAPLPEVTYTAKASGDKLVAWVIQKAAASGNSFEADNMVLSLPGPGAPAAPTNLHTANVSSNEVDLAWDASTTAGVASYTVYSGSTCSNVTPLTSVAAPTTTYADTSVQPSTAYAYEVDAVDSGGNRSAVSPCVQGSTPAAGVPAAPTNLRATSVLSGEIDLTWDPSPTAGVASYTLYRGPDCASVTPLTSVAAPATSYADITVSPSSPYAYEIDAVDGGGNHSAISACLQVTTPGAGSSGAIIAAVGDISCDPLDANFNSGNGQNNKCAEKSTAALVSAGSSPGTPYDAVLPLGDLQYDCGSLAKFNASYDQAWGVFSASAYPVLGNHEYTTTDINNVPDPACDTNASGYFQYFAGYNNPNYLGINSLGYYSRTIGTWHVIALNSNCANLPSGGKVDGCAPGSPQELWLKGDLSANPSTCTLAFWHHAPWSSHGNSQGVGAMRPMWADLANAGADLVLVGHFHHYERFADMNGAGVAVPDGTGMRELVVGTGGETLGGFNATLLPASQVRNSSTFGIASITLGPGNYSWNFIPAPPGTFTDSGTDTCH